MTPKFTSLLLLLYLSCSVFGQKTSNLPNFVLDTKAKNFNFSDYSESKLSVILQSDSFLTKDIPVRIKYRGNSAAHYKKKSFSLKLSENEIFPYQNPSKNWKLNAEYIDKTFLRNKLSYELFRLFSSNNYSPQLTYVNLFFNKKYRGLYTLTERVDKQRLNLSLNDTSAVLFKEPPISQQPVCHKENYINFVKYYYWAPRYKEYSKMEMDKVEKTAYFNQRYPDIDSVDKTFEIYQLTNFIYYAPDSIFNDSSIFSSYFNLENIIDWHLLLLVTNNADGVVKNFYLFKKDEKSPYLFCPWDYDHGFGRDGDGEKHTQNLVDFERMELINRLLRSNSFHYRHKLYEKFMQLKERGILKPEFLIQRTRTISEYLETDIKQNEKKWPLRKMKLFKESSFNSEIALIINWIPEQLQRVEDHLRNLTQN